MRGRKPTSIIRDNIVELLFIMKKAHGYDLSQRYNEIFPQASQRVIYYHLKKGVHLGLFKVAAIKKEKGSFTWGPTAEKIYYALDAQAKPQGSEKVFAHFNTEKLK